LIRLDRERQRTDAVIARMAQVDGKDFKNFIKSLEAD